MGRGDRPRTMGKTRCSHGRAKRMCVQCTPCPHGRLKYNCAACNPCPHGKVKRKCPACKQEPFTIRDTFGLDK